MKRAHWVAVGSAVAVTGTGALWALQRSAPAEAVVAEAPAAPAAVAILEGQRPEAHCTFEGVAAESYQLEVQTRSTVTIDPVGGQVIKPVTSDQVSQAVLSLKPLSHDAQGTVLLSNFRRIQGTASALPDLNTPFLVRISEACELIAFARQSGADLATARAQQAITWELSWRFTPEKADVTGENGLGAWRAWSMPSATDQGVMVQRRVLAYSQLWQSSEANVAPADSLLTVHKSPASGWFDTASGSETLTTRTMTTRNSVIATRIEALAEAFVGVDADASHYVWQDLLPRQVTRHEARPVTQRDLREREAVKHLTANQAVDAYIARVKQGKGIAETWPALTTYLEARPDQTEAVVNRLKADMPAEATTAAFIALGRARTPEALNALLDIKRDVGAPTFERVRAMFSLVDRDDVNVGLAQELKEDSKALLSPSTRGGSTYGAEALLAVTTMSGLRGESDVHDVAMQAVGEALTNNRERRTLKPVFRAMANVGDPALLATARPYMNDPDPLVRREVAIVFRRMPADASLPVAMEWLRVEPDEMVRRHIYETLELQLFDAKVKTPDLLVSSAARDLATQPSIMQRKALVRLIARAENLTPDVRMVLKNQARKELASNSGLFNSIAHVLSPEDLREVAPE